ncbi:MAG: endonuclease/exonuclease/phosphatase family protein [Polyangiaceae bacterium]|nr:endonuclease/exonuclease/phosphatase family protein [Polyangiaceae bacterium]MCL4753129.1 endonuclease/exonuclease/phosphatase family protein [Myxococcales bacterium]
MRFRVVTWNIHKGIGGLDRLYRIERVAGALREIAPDIALLQEVAQDLPRARHHEQLGLLGAELGMRHAAFSPQHRFTRGGYGNAILSRWPLHDVSELDLTIGTRKKRGALSARARLRLGRHARSVVVCCMHLGLAGSERDRQLERFLSSDPFRGLHRRTPVVLGGDLNDLWGTLGPRLIEPAGFRRAGRLWSTFPAWLPIRPLDGVFVRGDAVVVHAAVSRTVLSESASDHLPLYADLALEGLSA